MKPTNQMKTVLQQIFAEATAEGKSSLRVKAGDVLVATGGGLASNAQIEACCQMMVREMGRRDRIEAARQKASVTG